MALLAALLGAAAVLLCAAPALPQAPLRVILIDHGNVALGRKLQAEGSYAGFSFVEPSALDGSAPDAARLERAGAAAVIELASEEQVELTVASSREASARVSLVRRAGDAESFPLRVIEQLRAQLVDLGWQLPTDAEPPAAPAAPPVLPATPATSEALDAAPSPSSEPAAPRLWLKGGSSVLLAAGGVGPSAHGLLGAELQWGDVWGVGAVALLPLHQNEIRGLEGEADVSVNVFSVQASVRQPLGARWLGTAALGPGLVVLPLSADA
ncbi:MAG TPA: hypothetical protein VNN80_19105, partial [Polyangiaceae bacterium]|nr:hypothetical protein [Polyangiaceae bacterium]